jgi:hypothetical protein
MVVPPTIAPVGGKPMITIAPARPITGMVYAGPGGLSPAPGPRAITGVVYAGPGGFKVAPAKPISGMVYAGPGGFGNVKTAVAAATTATATTTRRVL